MSSLVLLDSEGVVVRKLGFVSLPHDYVVPEGMTISWRQDLRVSHSDPLIGLRGPRVPFEAYFYRGKAQAQVCLTQFKDFECDDSGRMRFGSYDLTITVQGTRAKDVMELYERIRQLISSNARWKVSNDLNPKFFARILGRFLAK